MTKSPPNKTMISDEIMSKIIELFNLNYGSRKIAEAVGLGRIIIIRVLKENNLRHPLNVSRSELVQYKVCKVCKIEKSITEFYKQTGSSGRKFTQQHCKKCNTDLCRERNKKSPLYKKTQKKYREKNRDSVNKNFNRYVKERSKKDSSFKLRREFSSFMSIYLKKNDLIKSNTSCVRICGYSIDELKRHLESQFEPWMNWDNRGKYDPNIWVENDSSTWTWQMDHIIPHSDLPYSSFDDENFKKCWALNNLRPLSAKQNVLDGVNRVRHKDSKNE